MTKRKVETAEVTKIQAPTSRSDELPAVFAQAEQKVPKTKRGEQTCKKVLDAARTIFARDGFTGTRVSDIATEADVALGTFYGYFDDKDSVFRAVVEPVLQELYLAARSPYLDSDRPEIVLRESLRRYMVVYYENGDIMRTLTEAISVNQEFRDAHFEVRSHFLQRIIRNVNRASSGSKLDPLLEASALGCMVENFCWVWFSMGGERQNERPMLEDVKFDDMVEVLSALFMAGVFQAAPAKPAAAARKSA
jgi:AcrR family transcriptional regulator